MKISLKITNIILIFLFAGYFAFFPFNVSGRDAETGSPEVFISHCVRTFVIGQDTLIRDSGFLSGFRKKDFPFRDNYVSIELNVSKESGETKYLFDLKGERYNVNVLLRYPFKEYTNLPPGNYLLQIFLVRDHGEKLCMVYPFRILAPFYKTRVAYLLYITGILLLIWTVFSVWNYNFAKQRYRLEGIINKRTEELLMEKDRTEQLLANVLPKDTADEIKSTGKAKKKKFEMVTVLFSDIQGFTKIAESLNPEVLIDQLDHFFFHFDSVVEKYNIEKIKTIGDAYMCAGGIPEKNRTNPVEVVLAALEMQQYMINLKKDLTSKKLPVWDIRIGIHTGSVIAGVIGHKKLSYDIWGDTVNTASRMESSGEAGKINISGSTYELVKDFFICEYRGKMPVKYKGEIDMYFVEGIRPELTEKDRSTPNRDFFVRLQMLRLQDLEEYIIQKLEKELPSKLHFHNLPHIIHVHTMVELLGRAEQISDEEMLLVRTAALLHDMGYLMSYAAHEKASCDFALEILPKYKYTEEQIRKVCKLILANIDPYHPKDKVEMIMIDANYNYLSRVDFREVALRIWLEVKEFNDDISFDEWKQEMIALLENFRFHTPTAKKLRDVPAEEQIRIIRELRET
jgi:class 3 adenylate cyclase